jgi:hypothetical protein
LERSRIAGEAADVLLYTLMLFDRLGLDPVTEAMKKIDLNRRRFPIEKTLDKPASALKALKHAQGTQQCFFVAPALPQSESGQ